MPEYLAPGVYVEETSFRAKSIEGVGTSTTAFVGPTRKGPFRAGDDTPETPELLTSYGDFERIYGGFDDLALGGVRCHELSRPRGPRFLQRRGIAVVRVARGRCGRGIRGRGRPRRRRRRAGAVRRAFPRRGRQRRRHRARTAGARIAGDDGDGAGRHAAALGSGGGAGASPSRSAPSGGRRTIWRAPPPIRRRSRQRTPRFSRC